MGCHHPQELLRSFRLLSFPTPASRTAQGFVSLLESRTMPFYSASYFSWFRWLVPDVMRAQCASGRLKRSLVSGDRDSTLLAPCFSHPFCRLQRGLVDRRPPQKNNPNPPTHPYHKPGGGAAWTGGARASRWAVTRHQVVVADARRDLTGGWQRGLVVRQLPARP